MTSDEGFLGRWSRRKAQVRQGRNEDDVTPLNSQTADARSVEPVRADPLRSTIAQSDSGGPVEIDQQQAVTPTIGDVQQLTAESDFTSFMAPDVAPEVKNAAMKKLFTDPHFNVMDGLDIYIDDYSQSDPLPVTMLRQMASVKALNLFNNDSETASTKNIGDMPSKDQDQVVAQSELAQNISNTKTKTSTHDHADLRLQPDPTSRPEGSEPKPI